MSILRSLLFDYKRKIYDFILLLRINVIVDVEVKDHHSLKVYFIFDN